MRTLYRAGWAVAVPVARLLARGESKLARTIRGRLGAPRALAAWSASARDTSRPLIWFHAASVGEARQAEAVMLAVRRARPDWQLACTFASASAERLAGSLPADVTAFLPVDTPRATAAALRALAPAALVFSATDVWPELVRQAAAGGVPVGLVAANLGELSSRRGLFARALLRPAYAALDLVGAVDQADAAGLASLGVAPARIRVAGDSRHDAAAARADAGSAERAALLAALGRRDAPVLVAGSTWPSDERELLPALVALEPGATPRLVIAPHEPAVAHLEALLGSLAAAFPGAAVRRLSELEHAGRAGAAPAWDVCVVDRVGALFDLYAAAQVAYVGGGFHRAGLHSVIEPAAFGVPVVCGPRWRTSRDARLLLEAGGAVSAADARGLTAALARLLQDTADRAAAGAAARAVVDRGIGAAARSARLVIELAERIRGEA
jgi:3-deoxy-D-manno-octulosonic-acid transferase